MAEEDKTKTRIQREAIAATQFEESCMHYEHPGGVPSFIFAAWLLGFL
jgi:hypothetical protein